MFTPYDPQRLSVAYQLRWSLSIFPTVPLDPEIDWVEALSQACEPDGIRILEVALSDKNVLSLLISTKPFVVPKTIVQRVKGRLQHLLKQKQIVGWQRNFRLTAVGDANARAVDGYIASQLGHHFMASPVSQRNLEALQWVDPSLDLTKCVNSAHGQYSLGLHVVLVHSERWCNANLDFVELTRNAIRGTLSEWDCPAARISPLADHVHFNLRLHYETSPSDLIVKIMNEVCDAHGGTRIWMEGYYVGTVGCYDMAAVRRKLKES